MTIEGEGALPPRDYGTLRELVIARWEGLPPRLTQVAEYALENPDEIAFGTAASIASKANVQPSTLVRFSQAMGYQGFSDLQDVFRSRLKDRVLNYDERLARMREHGMSGSKANMILDGFAEAAERSIGGLAHRLEPETLDSAVARLAAAETIYLVGLRRSFPITSYMAYTFGKLGIRSILVDAVAGLAPEQTSFVTDRDVAIVISFTPYANETVTLANAIKANGAGIVSITDSVFSPIAAPADVLLEVAEADFEGFRTMAATMTLAMTLTVAIADKRKSPG